MIAIPISAIGVVIPIIGAGMISTLPNFFRFYNRLRIGFGVGLITRAEDTPEVIGCARLSTLRPSAAEGTPRAGHVTPKSSREPGGPAESGVNGGGPGDTTGLGGP